MQVDTNGIFCCFGFMTLTGFRNQLCSRLVYFPPNPETYMFDQNDTLPVEDVHSVQLLPQRGKDNTHTMWIRDEYGKQCLPMHGSSEFKFGFVRTRKRKKIAFMWIGYNQSQTTILFSHGNATDIGCMRDYLLMFSNSLHVNVLAYDYSGYGLSSGKPTPANTYADIEAVYQYLKESYPTRSRYIILYGQSLGSGPTLYLAGLKNVSGVVIHSGLMSGLRVLQHDIQKSFWFDVYPNIEMVKIVKAPVMVIHGTADHEIPLEHGHALLDNAPNAFQPWFVEGGGHNDIESRFQRELFANLYEFFQFVTNEIRTT